MTGAVFVVIGESTKARLQCAGRVTLALAVALASHVAVAADLAAASTSHTALPVVQKHTPSDAELATLAARINTLGQRIADDGLVTGMAIAIVQNDTVLLEKGYGVTTAGSREAIDEHTAFRLASLSKAFAATVSAMLVSEGAMRWDTRIAEHLPAFKLRNLHAAQTLTVQDILSHRVGLPYNTGDKLLEQDEPYPLLVAKLGEIEPVCDAGDCYGYQNIAFSLIGDMVFATTGDFYSHQVEKRIFHPLGMLDATYGRDGLEMSARWARPHIRKDNRWVAVQPRDTYYRVPPAAGVNASIHDLTFWLRAQLGRAPTIISPAVLATVQTPLVETPHEMTASPWRRERLHDAHYAMGWRIYDYMGEKLVYHAGAVQGYRAMAGMLPEHGFGFVAVWNCESATPAGLLATALDDYLGLPDRDFTGLDAIKQVTKQPAKRIVKRR